MNWKQAISFVIALAFVAAVNVAAFSQVLAGEEKWIVEEVDAGASEIRGEEMLVVKEEQLSPSVERAVTAAAEENGVVLDSPPVDAEYVVVTNGELEGVYRIVYDTPTSYYIRLPLAILSGMLDGGILYVIVGLIYRALRGRGVAVFRL